MHAGVTLWWIKLGWLSRADDHQKAILTKTAFVVVANGDMARIIAVGDTCTWPELHVVDVVAHRGNKGENVEREHVDDKDCLMFLITTISARHATVTGNQSNR